MYYNIECIVIFVHFKLTAFFHLIFSKYDLRKYIFSIEIHNTHNKYFRYLLVDSILLIFINILFQRGMKKKYLHVSIINDIILLLES